MLCRKIKMKQLLLSRISTLIKLKSCVFLSVFCNEMSVFCKASFM